jgi:large conductance mechanosensitive channel
MSILNEFREFAMKGNVVDLAIGVVIGTAFGAITNSLVADVIMPPIGVLMGGLDFTHYNLTLAAAEGGKPAVVLSYGKFIQTLINFLIVAWAMFMIVKLMNRLRRAPAPTPETPPRNEVLLEEIRDLLKK